MPPNVLRKLPSVSELLESPPLKSLVDRVNHNVVVSRVRTMLDDLRRDVQHAASEISVPSVSELADRIARRIQQEDLPPLRTVINATGVLLPDRLGRAPLADAALEEMVMVARGYANVELDLRSGAEGRRVAAVEPLLCELTGAEAALVVNNNAGATLLTLAALAAGRDVVISRGQLVESGADYRLPDTMIAAGVRPREVGTTNHTRLSDYADALGDDTAMLLVVRPTDFVVVGSHEAPALAEVASLGRQRGLPVVHDIGAATLVDLSPYGLPDEPQVGASLRDGADLVLFCGDKLLGGPQAGIIVGRKDLIQQLGRHPLARALRADKLTLAALAATLRLYRKPTVADDVPWLQLLSTPLENLQQRAMRLAPQLAATSAVAEADAMASKAWLAGQNNPGHELDTWCVWLKPARGGIERLAAALRDGIVPVVGRIEGERLILDLRSVLPSQDLLLAEAVARLD